MEPDQTQRGADSSGSTPDTMRIGPVPFLGVLIFSLLIFIPATRSFGLTVMVLLGIPIFIGWCRARRLSDGSRGLTSANATICGLMVLIGSAMGPDAPTDNEAVAAATATMAPQIVAPSAPRVAVPPAPRIAATQSAPVPRPQPAVVSARRAHPPAKSATRDVAPVTPKPVRSKQESPQDTSSLCAGSSYINSDGNCVHTPVKSRGAPGGASAKCKDGTYSFSKHRQGTCSRHGGVSEWL